MILNLFVQFRKRKAAMLIYIAVVLTVGVVAGVWAIIELRRTREARETLINEVRELRLKSRARISEASIQSGPRTQEQSLKRLGRASVGRRVVVGGDDNSELKRHLRTQAEEGGDNG